MGMAPVLGKVCIKVIVGCAFLKVTFMYRIVKIGDLCSFLLEDSVVCQI